MATSGSKSVVVTSWDTLKFSWERESYSIANNTSTISWKMELITGTYGRISSTYNRDWEVTVNGTKYSGTSNINIGNNSTKTLASGSTTISHNSDGSKTFSYSFSQYFGINFSGNLINTKSGSGSGTLDKIPRKANITAAPNFNDEDNPTISYSNPAGNAVDKLDACISLDGSGAEIPYRNISKTGNSYTFNLTTAERETLRNATKTSNSRKVRFYVRTEIAGTTYLTYFEKTFSIVNGNPTFKTAVTDINTKTTALTGNNKKLVKYFSNASINSGAVAVKGATLKSQKVTNGSKSISAATGTINAVESNKFVFSATDSRGNVGTYTYNADFVDYVKLTCNFGSNSPNTDGTFTFLVKGNYFNGSFGAVANTISVYYRYKDSNAGSYTEWAAMTVAKSGNSYTATADISGLDYKANYIFQAYAIDKLTTIYTEEKPIKSLPIFDWSDKDFAFHVPVILDNAKQLYFKSTDDSDVMMISLNNYNQSFFGYGGYNQNLGSTYFDGNSVYIRSRNNISNTAEGTIGGNKAWTNSSDKRLKEDIADVPEVFSAIWYELQPKIFRWNEINKGDNTLHFGLIAQDVIDVFTKYGLDWRNYGFVSTIPVEGVEYFAITYEYYNILTAKVLKNTIEELQDLKKELAGIKAALAS